MKRSLLIALVGVATIGAALYFHRPGVSAEAAPAGAQSKVALLNLSYVLKYYQKYQNYQNDVKKAIQKYEAPVKLKQKQLAEKGLELRKPTLAPADKETLEQEVRQLRRELEDLQAEARKDLGERSKQIVTIYQEIQDAARKHANSQGIDLVLHFQDAPDATQMNSEANIMRKLRIGGCVPLYWQPGADISRPVVISLNAKFRGGK